MKARECWLCNHCAHWTHNLLLIKLVGLLVCCVLSLEQKTHITAVLDGVAERAALLDAKEWNELKCALMHMQTHIRVHIHMHECS